jgi:hypothetical protein
LNGSRKTVLSLIPQESNPSKGLRFHLWSRNLATWLNLPGNDDLLPMLPPDREQWLAFEKKDPEHEGFQGFFLNADEVDRFVKALERSKKTAAA